MDIRLRNVQYTYPDGSLVLDSLSVTLSQGEQVALVGLNGSGKTTLVKQLNGLLRPQHGEVWIGDWLTSAYTTAQLAQRVAFVFQNPDEQLFRQRVWDEVAFGPQNLGYEPIRVKALVADALSMVGLEDAADQNPRDLGYSGRKRVGLAAALAMDTPALVFDEPTGGMDTQELNLLAQVLRTLRGRDKIVLVISHDLDFVAENLGRVILLDHGRVVMDAPASEFFQSASRQPSYFLQLPQIVQLSQRLGQPQAALTVEQFLENCLDSKGIRAG
jgi:energy-coupling factor transport system ATP-binding protein